MKKTVLVTGSAGLVGSECVRFFSQKGFEVIGIDNNMRMAFFGKDASVEWNKKLLLETVPSYTH
ncbi:MAG: NAD-dependent epimerase/dehydratase family protein, partial [Candidatus Omnitrophota bacterium]